MRLVRLLENLDDSDDFGDSNVGSYSVEDGVREPWLENELLSSIGHDDPYALYQYAFHVFRPLAGYESTRWPEAEPMILNDYGRTAISYAQDILKGRWLALEKKLLESKDPNLIYEYIMCTSYIPWPEAEPILKQSKSIWYRYLDACEFPGNHKVVI